MGLFHRAVVTPSKPEMIESWGPTQDWWPDPDAPVEVVGAFRFDDPDGQVGMETHLVRVGGNLLQVPLTYRNEPLEGAESAFVTTTEHTVLGTRWVYDGLGDDLYLVMLAAVAMTGQGETLGMAVYDGRWYVAPATVRIEGGGWSLDRVPVDGFERQGPGDVFVNDGFELVFHRAPVTGPRPHMGLQASGEGLAEPVLVAQVSERS